MLKKFLRRACAAIMAASLFVVSANALDANKIQTEFDMVVYQIERYGLFAEDHPMTDSQRADYNARIARGESLSTVVNEILAGHDTHSFYLTPEDYSQSFGTLTESYVGIGITVRQQNGNFVITGVNFSGPAREAGIQAGDILTGINGESVAGRALEEVSALLQGQPESKVYLTIDRAGESLRIEVARRAIHGDYVQSETLEPGIEYISIEAFGTMDDAYHFNEIWDGLDEKGTAAVILDLRGNGGGLVDAALEMLDTMLPDAVQMVSCRWRRDRGGTQDIFSDGGGLPLNGIYVLVDHNTASAAEMMAACLKDTGAGMLVGETTYGKSQGQYHLTMVNGDSLVITTLEMSTPRTGVWEGKGVVPNLATETLVSVPEYLKKLPALPEDRALLFGETGDAVLALTGRLEMLGLLTETSDTLDAKALEAVREFQRDVGLTEALCADTETLKAVNRLIAAASDRYVDYALRQTLEMARTVARQPLKYRSAADGSWTAA